MTAADSGIAVPITEGNNTGLIAFDLTCLGCGYNLRGLREGGVCPECNAPVEKSLRGDRLIYAPASWLKQLRRGTELKLWHFLFSIIAAVAALLMNYAGVESVALIMIPSLLVGVLSIVALFLLTTQEPNISAHSDPAILRNVVRTCAVAAFLGEGVTALCLIVEEITLYAVFQVLSQLAGILATLCVLVLLARLARRVPDDELARSTRTAMWGFIIGPALFLVSIVLMQLMGTGGSMETIAMTVSVAAGVMMLVAAILFVIVLFKFRRVFMRAIRLAGQPPTNQSGRQPGAKL